MRDDRHKWPTPVPGLIEIDLGGAAMSSLEGLRQTLISGPKVLTQMSGPLGEWPQPVQGDSYSLSLRRDRVLQVNGSEPALGWNADLSQAVSDATDLYAVFSLSGEGAFEILKRGAEISLEIPSKSVVRRLFGLSVMVYAYEARDQFRLHVERASREALVAQISAAAHGVS